MAGVGAHSLVVEHVLDFTLTRLFQARPAILLKSVEYIITGTTLINRQRFYENWSLPEWLDHLENRYHEEMRLGLARILHVAGLLQVLHPSSRVITVAGTNGKGTTVAALESIYLTAGYRVGSYTSPHLLRVNERIKLNGQAISDDALCIAFSTIEFARAHTEITYFEALTLAALLYFKQHQVDIMILEVGLGGRLDATNIISPDLSIITTIDYDHQAQLGTTLEQIGFEKAGIIRRGKPVIYADFFPPQTIRQCAQLIHAPLYCFGIDFNYAQTSEIYIHLNNLKAHLKIDDHPWHPHAVASAAFATFLLQACCPIKPEDINDGIQRITLQGRLQSTKIKGREVLLDVSHNPQSVARLATYLQNKYSGRKIHAIFSGLTDKNIQAMIEVMIPHVSRWYPARLQGKRAAPKEQIDALLRKYGIINDMFYESPYAAFLAAQANVAQDDVIVVYGSFLTVSGVLSFME